MAVLVWRHGKSREEVRETIQIKLQQLGHGGKGSWAGARATARVGPWGTILDVRGEITDDVICLEKYGGLAGSTLLGNCRETLGRLFPDGEVV